MRREEKTLLRNSILVDVFCRNFNSSYEQLDYVLHKALELTESKIGCIYLYNEISREFSLNSWSKNVLAECTMKKKQTKFKLDKIGLWGEVVRQRKPIVINDFKKPNFLIRGYPKGHVELLRFMVVPIIIDETIEAVIGLANKEEDYDDNDIYQITVLMTGVWNALERRERIVELEKTNAELKENKEKLQLILDSTADAIYGIDKNGRCTFCNPSGIKMLGYRHQNELIGNSMHLQIHHSYKDGTPMPAEKCKIYKTLITGECFHVDDEVFWRADGSCFDVEYFSYPQYKDGEVIGAVVTFRDISERKQAEERKWYHLFKHFKDIILFLDTAGNIVQVNNSAVKAYGYDEKQLCNMTISQIDLDYSKSKSGFILNLLNLAKERGYTFETLHKRKDGSTFPVEVNAQIVKLGSEYIIMCLIQDITQKKLREKELLETQKKAKRAEKLAMLGVMAADIAHEINQPLNILKIIVEGSLYKHELGTVLNKDEILKELQEISAQVNNLEQIIKKMTLMYKNNISFEQKVTDLNNLIEIVLEELAPSFAINQIQIEKVLSKIPTIYCNQNFVKEVIRILIVNAIHALEMVNRNTKKIKCVTKQEGNFVIMEINDNGPGIEKNIIDNIFEPFFSTKKSGKGMGLGLTIAETILMYLNGQIRAKNNDMGGATFEVKIAIR